MGFTARMRTLGLAAWAVLGAAAIGVAAGGCTPSYINVPSIGEDTALNNPDLDHVVKVEAAALQRVMKDHPPEGQYAIELPEGTGPGTYRRVLEQLPQGGNRGAVDGEIPVYQVAQVQVRGYSAQVDVVRKNEFGERKLVSVYLGTDIEGWYVTRTRVWQISVDRALEMLKPLPKPAGE